MVGGIAAEDVVEGLVIERQALGSPLLGADVVQPALGGRACDHVQHLGGQVVGHHLVAELGDLEAHMTGTAAQVEYPGPGVSRHRLAQQDELLALGVNGTVQIGGGLAAELALDHILVLAGGHGEPPLADQPWNNQGWRWR